MTRRETETIEFKKSTSELRQAVISLSSMLNKRGCGTVYFGVLNNGQVVGQQIGSATTHDISVEIKNHIRPTVIPSIEIESLDGHEVIKVQCSGDNGPYSAYSKFYIRSDDEDLVMTNDELQGFFERKCLDYSKWENTPSGCTLDDIDEDRLIQFYSQALDCGRLPFVYKDVSSALSRLGLLCGSHNEVQLNNAGLYLFSKTRPIKLKLAVFNTEDRVSFSDIRLFEGNIFDCIETACRYISDNIRWNANIVGIKRVEEPEIPMEAVREIVVNSFAHMKASQSILNEIYITPSKVKITNPGSIAMGLDPMDFASGSAGPVLRNPLIAMTLYRNGMIDSFATGFERVFRLCRNKGIDYEYSDNGYSFSFTFFRHHLDSYSLSEQSPAYLSENNDRKQGILNIIRVTSNATAAEIAKSLGVSVPTISRDIKSLQDLGLLKRVGANKNGHWEIIDPLF